MKNEEQLRIRGILGKWKELGRSKDRCGLPKVLKSPTTSKKLTRGGELGKEVARNSEEKGNERTEVMQSHSDIEESARINRN